MSVAEEATGTVSTYAEGWHYETVTPLMAEACDVTEDAAPAIPALGTNPCSLLPSSSGITGPASIFAADTLQVARLNGVSIAATYLQLDMFDAAKGLSVLPEGATLTGGVLTLPVAPTELSVQQSDIVMDAARDPSFLPYTVLGLIATAAGLVGVPVPALPVPVPQLPVPELPLPETAGAPVGYVGVENAQLVACPVVADFFVPSEASLDEPPEIDCGAAHAEATYHDDGIQPTFILDLDGFADVWGDDDPAIAIIPSPATAEANESWIVSFWGKDNPDPMAQPIVANLTYTTKSRERSGGSAPIALENRPREPVATSDNPPQRPAEVAPTVPEHSTAVAHGGPRQTETPVAAPPLFRMVGYAVPIAWLFPLLLLVGFAATGRSLTKPLDRRLAQ
ncbi:MAG: hypothetical protein GEU97_09300 [Actinophytocola sp.]|nr:hypothetical protein [Actinophytocola sp.]